MKDIRCSILCGCICNALLLAAGSLSAQVPLAKTQSVDAGWQIVVNNGVTVPGDTRTFNSYNQPSINVNKLVVFRARSKGGTSGEPAHGVFLRDMAVGTPLTTLFDRNTVVPQPNNLSITFREPPAFPRIDMRSDTVVSRGGHAPVWVYDTGEIDPETGFAITSRAGTSGIYTNALGTNPFDSLITGVDNLGAVPEFRFFRVPEVTTGDLKFDVFPGAPAD
jgi:hypothetical protein